MSIIKVIQQIKQIFIKLFVKSREVNILASHIRNYRNIRVAGTIASILLFIISALTIYPITHKSNLAEAATGTASSTSLTMTSDHTSANLDLVVRGSSGTFAESDAASTAMFSIATNNVSGYELSIAGSDNTGQLTNVATSSTLDSIDSYTDAETFTNGSAALYNGKWGYKPSMYNSASNTYFRPAPTEGGSTLNITDSANSKKSTATGDTVNCDNYTCNDYTIALGARADITTKAGTYTNTFILTAVGNPVTYSIDFEDLSGDTTAVANMPADISDVPTSSTEIDLPSTIPTRTKYTFNGWCSLPTTTQSDGSTTCSSTATVYNAGGKFGIDQTTTNNTTLYAIWKINAYDITIKTAPNITKVTLNGQECTSTSGCKVEGLIIGQSYRLVAKLATGYSLSSWSESPTGTGTFGSTTSASTTYTIGSGDSTITPSATIKNNLSLTIAFSAGVSSVAVKSGSASGTTVGTVTTNGGSVTGLTYGQNYYLVPSYASGSTFNSWKQNNVGSGGTGLSSTSDTTPYFNIGDGTNKVTLTAKHTITFKTSNAQSIVFNGTAYTNNQTVQIVAGTYNISGNYASGYDLSSWSTSGSISVASSSASYTTVTVSGAGTLTLTGKSCSTSISGTMQTYTAPSNLCIGAIGTLTDNRDSSQYKVGKLADGKIWMLDNLRLGSTSTISLTTSNTNIVSNWTLPASGRVCFSSSSCTGTDGTTTGTGYTVPAIYSDHKDATGSDSSLHWGDGSHKYGVYYNYCAASAGTYCYASGSGTGNASYDICPKGWRMPTGGSSGEYKALYTAYSSDYTNFRNALSTPLSGYLQDSSVSLRGTHSYYWSSTYYDGNDMYRLFVSSVNADPTSHYVRNYGDSVRCLLK